MVNGGKWVVRVTVAHSHRRHQIHSVMKVLIIDGSIYPDIYRPADHWIALIGDVPSESVHLPSGEPVPDLSEYTHLIVTGSEASINADDPWFEIEERIILDAFNRKMPILGSCFGHQMLARAISGRECVGQSPAPELGWIPIEVIEEDELFEGLKNPFHAFVSHFDEVRDPPAPWKVLARSEHCPVHAMRHGDRPVWGIQSHPEINPGDGRALLEGFIDKAPESADLIRPALGQTPRDDGIASEIVQRFLNT